MTLSASRVGPSELLDRVNHFEDKKGTVLFIKRIVSSIKKFALPSCHASHLTPELELRRLNL